MVLFHYYLQVASGRNTWAEVHPIHNDLALFHLAPLTGEPPVFRCQPTDLKPTDLNPGSKICGVSAEGVVARFSCSGSYRGVPTNPRTGLAPDGRRDFRWLTCLFRLQLLNLFYVTHYQALVLNRPLRSATEDCMIELGELHIFRD
jgi:hypothetical protein